jgi:CBS domain-containing protein
MSMEPSATVSEPRTAADLMDRRPATVPPTATVGQVARLLLERHVSGLPVVAESGEVIGLVKEADLVTRHATVHFPTYVSLFGMAVPLQTPRQERELDEETRRIIGRTAAEVMTEDIDPYVVSEDTPIGDVALKLAQDGLDPVVVLHGDRLAGLITRADLVRLVAFEEGTLGSPPA